MSNEENRRSDELKYQSFLQAVKESSGNIIENECRQIIDASLENPGPMALEVLNTAFKNVLDKALKATLLDRPLSSYTPMPSGTTTTTTVKGHNDGPTQARG